MSKIIYHAWTGAVGVAVRSDFLGFFGASSKSIYFQKKILRCMENVPPHTSRKYFYKILYERNCEIHQHNTRQLKNSDCRILD